MNDQMNDRQAAAKWAYDLLQRDNWCVLDTETTGLGSTAEICELGVLATSGEVLLNTLIKPTGAIEPDAFKVHGITPKSVAIMPTFEAVFVPLLKAVGDRDLLIYNAEFDLRLLRQSAKPYGFQLAFPTSDRRQCRIFFNGGSIHCAMQWYSRWVGEWHNGHGDYKWQKLPGGDHTAIGDCKAVLQTIKQMATDWERTIAMETEPKPAEAVAVGSEPATAIEFDDIPF